jgi:hypothetical protein
MVQEQVHQVPLNGLESFIEASPDYELAPIGLGSMREQVEKLAEYGRYGDIYVVHAAEGETVVPMEVLEANPKIKSLLFDQMSQMGLDPERYVVGNNLNSLNPVTGMPEFFFKKLWKGVKKFMPVIAPIVGNMIAPGIGGLIATGLTTKLSGGSWGDALKATAIAYGTQAVYQGLSHKNFSTGFGEGLTAPFHAGKGLLSWDGTTPRGDNPLAQGIFYEGDEIFPTYDPEFRTESEKQASTAAIQNRLRGLRREAVEREFVQTPYGPVPKERLVGGSAHPGPPKQYTETPLVGGSDGTSPVAQTSAAGDHVAPSEMTDAQKEIFRLESEIGGTLNSDQRLAVAKEYAASANKGPYEPYLGELSPSKMVGMPSDLADVALIGGGLYFGGAFDPDEPEQPVPSQLAGFVEDQVTAEELLAADPDRFRIGLENLNPNIPVLGETEIPSMFAAQGGTVNYPRRTGQINGPGTGTSDSIPAMLSNGEFVMTKRAVDGAGGPGTMYDLMRNFEMRT